MSRILALALVAAAATALVSADFADARRLGGARNFGAQRQQIAPAPKPPAATPSTPATPAAPGGAASAPSGAASNPVMPAQPGAAATRAAPGATGAAAAQTARSGASRWLGPIAGIAAGLGLAALAAHLGISEALLSVLLVALIAFAAIALLRALFARRAAPVRPSPLAYSPTAGSPAPAKLTAGLEPVFGAARPAAPVHDGRYPPGFDPEPFLEQAKHQFTRLQAAHDRGDREALQDVMTPEMYVEIAKDLDTRGRHEATDIVSLEAEIVDVTTEGDEHWASVRFRGLLAEDGAPTPKPFDELWNLVKPVDGSSGWLLAGIRQLEEAPAGHA